MRFFCRFVDWVEALPPLPSLEEGGVASGDCPWMLPAGGTQGQAPGVTPSSSREKEGLAAFNPVIDPIELAGEATKYEEGCFIESGGKFPPFLHQDRLPLVGVPGCPCRSSMVWLSVASCICMLRVAIVSASAWCVCVLHVTPAVCKMLHLHFAVCWWAVAAVGGGQASAASAASSTADDFSIPPPFLSSEVPASPLPGAVAASSASPYPIGGVIELQEGVQTLTAENNTILEEKFERVSRVDALGKSLKEALDQVEELKKLDVSSTPEAEQRGGVTIVSSLGASDPHTSGSVLIAEWRAKVDALEKELEETKEELEQTRIEKDALGDKWTDEMIKELEPLEEKLIAVEAENERLGADLVEALEGLDRREGRLLLLRFR